MDSCVKSRQTVGTGDENILYTPVFQAVEYRCSAFGALIFIDPHAQNIFSPILVDANGDIDRFLHDLPLVADMVVDGVQKHHGVNVHIPDREPRLHGELAPPCRKGAPLFHEQF